MKHSRRKSIYHKLSVCFVAGEVDLLESRTLLSAEPFRDPISLTAGTGTQLTNQPRFHWESPGAGVIRYDLFINRVGERSTPIYRAENIIGSFPSHETTDGLPNGEYEVWIRADFDDGGCTRWGKTPSLLSIVAEHPLSLFNPAQTSVQKYRPEFRWGLLKTFLTTKSGSVGMENALRSSAKQACLPRNLLPRRIWNPDTIKFWLRGHLNNSDPTFWTFPIRFTIAEEELVVTGGVGVQSDQHPALTWRAAENGSGYVVRILPVREDGPSYYRTVQGVGTSHRVVDELPDGDYRVYVTENRDGVRTRTGDGHLLQIRSETVDAVNYVGPAGTLATDQPNFTWENHVGDVAGYQIRVTPVGSETPFFDVAVAHSDAYSSYRHAVPLSVGA